MEDIQRIIASYNRCGSFRIIRRCSSDALISLIKILSTLHDSGGDVSVPGLQSYIPSNIEYLEEIYREGAG